MEHLANNSTVNSSKRRAPFPRSEEVSRRNRRVGWIAATVVILLIVGSIIYVYFFGGINKGPMQPLHSERATSSALHHT